jgi:hypothetical protein
MNRITVAVAIEYSSNRNCTGLSPATIAALEAATAFLNNRRDNDFILAHCNTFMQKAMPPKEADSQKAKLLMRLLARPVARIAVEAANSIEEAKNIRDALTLKGIEPRKIILFCDQWHAMRLRVIWSHVFPGIEIEIRSGRYIHGGDYKQLFLRSEFTWWLANIVGLIAMKVFGIERVAGIKEP